MSVRSDILGHIETILKGVAGLVPASVYVGKTEEVDLDAADLSLPLTFAIQGPEQKAPEQVHGFETWNWTITAEVLCPYSSVETLYAAIHAALVADLTVGGHARKIERTGGDVMPIHPGRGISVFQLFYQVQYRHPFGTP